jgi:hypothetical protein
MLAKGHVFGIKIPCSLGTWNNGHKGFLFRKRKIIIPLFEGAGGGLYLKKRLPL